MDNEQSVPSLMPVGSDTRTQCGQRVCLLEFNVSLSQ